MLRRTLAVRGEYGAIVIGGGAAGCQIAGRLAEANVRTLLVEEGPDVRKKKWHVELPCAQYFHRMHKRYEATETTTPQRTLAVGEGSDAKTQPVTFMRPKVLGGSAVMGPKSWLLGSHRDWEGSGLDYKKDIQPAMLKVELMDTTSEPHRGRRGRYAIHPALAVSPYYRPFLEACVEHHVPLASGFNKEEQLATPGCGRAEVVIDKLTMSGQTSLKAVQRAIAGVRPLSVATNTKALALLASENDRANVTGVKLRTALGTEEDVTTNIVVLCAGSTGSPQVLQASRGALALPDTFGEGLWDSPQVVLQFRTRTRDSLMCLRNALVQPIAFLAWKFLSQQSSLVSNYDDMVALVASNGSGEADLRLSLQPFVMDLNGEFPSGVEHGFQITVQLLTPQSRGSIGKDGSIDPNYFAVEADRQALNYGVELARKLVKTHHMIRVTDGEVVGQYMTSAGRGGVCRMPTVVDPTSYRLAGTENVYVCDGSVVANPLRGDYLPAVHGLTERFVEAYVNRTDENKQHIGPGQQRARQVDVIGDGGGAVKIIY